MDRKLIELYTELELVKLEYDNSYSEDEKVSAICKVQEIEFEIYDIEIRE